jgi:hypothetical protein
MFKTKFIKELYFLMIFPILVFSILALVSEGHFLTSANKAETVRRRHWLRSIDTKSARNTDNLTMW